MNFLKSEFGISTMFKPKRKAAYFHDRKRIEKGTVK